MLHDGSQGVAVSDNNHVLVIQDGWANCIMPEWEYSLDRNLEGFGARKSICWQVGVLWCKSWVSLVIKVQGWWRDVIASSPLQNLLLTVLSGCL